MKKIIEKEFLDKFKEKEFKLYNEFSLQFELAMFLRHHKEKKIQLERNVGHYGLGKDFIKKEIDIVEYVGADDDIKNITAIELKFPINGQVPEQMFSFIKDIKFLEQLNKESKKTNYFLAITNDSKFWNKKLKTSGIYGYFRGKNFLGAKELKKEEKGIEKPTGESKYSIEIEGNYGNIEWKELIGDYRYILIEINLHTPKTN